MSGLNLADEPRDDLMLFMRRVFELACSDYDDGRRKRTGREIVDRVGVGPHRGLHLGLATSIYNKTIRSLHLADMERE